MTPLACPHSFRSQFVLLLGCLGIAITHAASEFRTPEGVTVEKVAESPLVKFPLFACYDDRGRLFVAEGTGKNLPGPEIVPLKLGKIVMLEDTNEDGKFDRRTVFADELIFPQGVLWHDGAVYAASHPAIWKFRDTNDDGVADQREELVGKFGFTGNGCDIHGPFAGPDGWLYWTQGRHGYRIDTREGQHLEGIAARIWRSRYDGSGLERIAGGGFDNAVELAFTESAELTGTADQYPGDMLLQYVDGGVYPRPDESTLAEFPRTGPLLGPIVSFSAAYPAALCGMVTLRSDHFGPGYRGALMTAQFNVRRLQQHTLRRDGAKLNSKNLDFVVSTDWDFHPTDVLEDADGSLLVVDMGSWFNYACPTQKIAKAEVTGSIYRIRRTATPRLDDPWGQKLAWASLSPDRLVALLGEARAKVTARSTEELVKRGGPAVTALASLVDGTSPANSLARREAVYVLSRIGTPEARAEVRKALRDGDADVRQVAAHCVSVERDQAALPQLIEMVVSDDAPRRRVAAEALGRLGRAEAVSALLASLRKGATDQFLEHSLVYALIRIGAFDATRAALKDRDPRVQRAVFIALDQMNGTERRMTEGTRGGSLNPYHGMKSANPHRGDTFVHVGNAKLTSAHIAPLRQTNDAMLQSTLLEIGARRPEWADDLLTIASRWLRRSKLGANERQALADLLVASAANPTSQRFVAQALVDSTVSLETRRALFGVLTRAALPQPPAAWIDVLTTVLRGSEPVLQREALNVVRIRKLSKLDPELARLSERSELPSDVRMTATSIRAPRSTLDATSFARLTAQLSAGGDPMLPVTAATTLGTARLDSAQRLALTQHLATSGPLTAPLLAHAFRNTREPKLAVALAKALVASPGAAAVPADALDEIFGPMPSPEILAAAQPLFKRRQQTMAQQAEYLGKLGAQMSSDIADPRRGEQVFFAQKTMCAACHEVNGRGGKLGPDLSRIGSIRKTIALLESIVFPSSTIVPEFRSYSLKLKDGTAVFGPIARETSDAVFLRSAALSETRVARADIESIAPSEISYMPAGLEKTMTPQELNDLLEYLYTLK